MVCVCQSWAWPEVCNRPAGCRRCRTQKAQALKMEAGKEEENKERRKPWYFRMTGRLISAYGREKGNFWMMSLHANCPSLFLGKQVEIPWFIGQFLQKCLQSVSWFVFCVTESAGVVTVFKYEWFLFILSLWGLVVWMWLWMIFFGRYIVTKLNFLLNHLYVSRKMYSIC